MTHGFSHPSFSLHHAEKCNGCRYQHGVCLGVRRDYLERWGDGELTPTYDSVAAPAA